jgi:hypothetical protein
VKPLACVQCDQPAVVKCTDCGIGACEVHRLTVRKFMPGHRESRFVAVAQLVLVLALALLVGCERADLVTSLEGCCLATDPEGCALDRIEPGERVQLASCNVTVEREAITRWDLATELAHAACVDDPRWWCVPETTRTLCARKLDPFCADFVDDWRGLRDCRARVFDGALTPTVCVDLFARGDT